ncbi:murein transglycosylase [Iodidimonas nitroreducens]|uniref:Murein transglycosylase n=1 Tax=Iodidimonas nitroreducens TaxID=1236968 RepID=A0A5A7N4S5_9PROT|nr:lytic murein transglycosylase [Iodidimonas nitroreducens]GAK32840.1 membrane-bound lytic murein transglycosylase B [alpha proteobacterium Q-1]GER02987.1 murein transglycosylase [Iodidimonas nitroreducens]
MGFVSFRHFNRTLSPWLFMRAFMVIIFMSVAFLPFAPSTLKAQDTAEDTDAPEPSLPPFDQWLDELRAEARSKGISKATIDAALGAVVPNERVVELDRKQPEFTQTFEEYLAARVSPVRIKRGREMMVEYREPLRAVADHYGVQPRFIAAIWGLETNYGSFTGGMNVIQSLATLAYDRRRSDFFRRQLFSALQIIDEGHITASEMKGSWAGAMGQSQFMPGSFIAYAEDFDKDGRRDIWNTPVDVFASIANYLKSHGWDDRYIWGRSVRVPPDLLPTKGDLAQETPPSSCSRALRNHSRMLSLAEWDRRGVKRLNGEALPMVEIKASLVKPGTVADQAFLTYGNYRAILSYNCSDLYALAVGHLADALLSAE